MLGKRQAQRDRLEGGPVFPVALDPARFHGPLAGAADRLFRDEAFAAFAADRLGRPSAPPSLRPLLPLLPPERGCSAAEASHRRAGARRWAAGWRQAAGAPLGAQRPFPLFRAPRVLPDGVRPRFEPRIAAARRAGLRPGGALRVARETPPILGRGAVEDPDPLRAPGLQPWIRALAGVARPPPAAGAPAHDLGRSFGPRLKGSADRDWADPEARNQCLAAIGTDARRRWRLTGAALAAEGPLAGREKAGRREPLLRQDGVESSDGEGGRKAAIQAGTAPERLPSATDPEPRHGRKRKSQRCTGHPARVAGEGDRPLILEAPGLAGTAGEATGWTWSERP